MKDRHFKALKPPRAEDFGDQFYYQLARRLWADNIKLLVIGGMLLVTLAALVFVALKK